MHHEYTIETQAKFDALNALIEQQSKRIAELEAELEILRVTCNAYALIC